MIGLIKGTARQIKTVSGLPLPIASYKSNSKLPIQELSLSINPTQSGSGDPAPDNIRPITGVSSVNVYRTGKNICGSVIESGSFDESGLNTNNNIRVRTKDYIPVKAGQTISVSFDHLNVSQGFFALSGYTKDDFTTSRIQSTSWIADGGSVTIDAGVKFIRLNFRKDNNAQISADEILNVMVVYGSTASDYEPYTGNTYLVQLGDTYYGATLDVVRGKLRVTHWLDEYDGSNDEKWSFYSSSGLRYSYYISRSHTQPAISSVGGWKSNSIPVSGSSENTPEDANRITCRGTFYSSKNLYIFAPPTDIPDLTALRAYLSNQPFQFWYPITPPIEIDLTPTQINSLLGSNNLWHDGNGDVESLKFMDRQLYFGR